MKKDLEMLSNTKKYGSVGDQAIIKETGETSIITGSYGTFTIHIDFNADWMIDNDKAKELYGKEGDAEMIFEHSGVNDDGTVTTDDGKKEADGWHYILDNGKKIDEKDVIVGIDNIRDYKINQINQINK